MKPMKPAHKTEKGQSLTEFALFVVILFILLGGVVDLGMAAFNYMAMRDAAQEGVTFGSVYPTNCTEIQDRVRSSLVDPAAVTIQATIGGVPCASATPTQACMGSEIVIIVTNPHYALTMPFIGAFLGTQELTLTAQMTGTILRPSCGP
jgi:Flp pilus assembly protein TadG